MNKGRSIRLFLVDGSPNGIITAEIMNWTGSIVVAPRSRIADLIKRDEVSRTGIYFLIGPDPELQSRSLVYIGESDNVKKRVILHNKDEAKDFWNRVCVVTSKDQNLTKAHVRYLESHLITIVQDAENTNLLNGTAPPSPALPEADTSDMEFFIEQVSTVMPVLGFGFLKPKPDILTLQKVRSQQSPLSIDEIKSTNKDDIHVFEMTVDKDGIRATAIENEGDFTVLKGSQARKNGTPSWKSYVDVHKSLVEAGKLVPTDDPNTLEFTEDVSFSSPSGAACVVAAAARNGRTSWKLLGTKQTYADWQEEQVTSATQDVW